jgi:hypothetical protein
MAESKYGRLIVTDTKPLPVELTGKMQERLKKVKSTMKSTRLLWLDDEMVKGSSFYIEYVWHWSGTTQGSPEMVHVHDFDEIVGFIGTVPDDPHALGAEIEIWLGGEKHILTKSCLIFIPTGLTHAPIVFRRIDTPILGFTIGKTSMYGRASEEKD